MNTAQTPISDNISALPIVQNPTDVAQGTIDKLMLALKNAGFSEAKLEETAEILVKVIVDQTMAAIFLEMNDKDLEDWKTFMAGNPNEAQQILVMDKFYQRKTGKTLEDLQDRIIADVVKSSVKDLNETTALAEKLSKLDEASAQKALDLVNSGKLEEAEQLVNDLSK